MTSTPLDDDLVRVLLREQHPDLADHELCAVAGGWDNQLWRLGDALAVRLPRTERAPALLQGELAWLPGLAAHLPLPVPVPVRVGVASQQFPEIWTINRWVEGEPADRAPISTAHSPALLAQFLTALHTPAPPHAPTNAPRGYPLAQVGTVDAQFEVIGDHPHLGALREVWSDALAAPAWTGPAVWLHGDLHPANVVTQAGSLAGVLDFGDLCAGDPASDLSAAWLLLPDGTAADFFAGYTRSDDAMIARARGWAVLRAVALVQIGRNGRLGRPGGKPTWEPAGHAALERVLAG